jgi:arginyl-tRNA synthetase
MNIQVQIFMIIQKLIANEIKKLFKDQILQAKIGFEVPKNREYGDLSTTYAMSLAKDLKKAPTIIAQELTKYLNDSLGEYLEASLLPPGFVNFKLKPLAFTETLLSLNSDILVHPEDQDTEPLLLEFVSANPTGDLHLGHGRGAVFGSALAELQKAVGRKVNTEFYINDAGEQMQKLGRSAWAIYSGIESSSEDYPREMIEPYLDAIPPNLNQEELTEAVKNNILAKQKNLLKLLRVEYDLWVSEKEDLQAQGAIEETLKTLSERGLTYEKDGALWLASERLGDERDRVLIKSDNKRPTYLAGDIAYHLHKLKRFPKVLDVFGADHKGQELSLKVAMEALGFKADQLEFLFIQFVSLQEAGQELKMSKRAGNFISVEELLAKVGVDAFRFIMLTSHINNRMVFDVDVALRADDQNPVFYVQYAHARACSILRNAKELSLSEEGDSFELTKDSLSDREISTTKDLILKMSFFNDEIHRAASTYNPSGIVHYLLDLSAKFHSFYNACRVIDEQKRELSEARLLVIKAFQRIMNLGLKTLLVDAHEKM